jgi:hypothetical protein
VNKSGSSNEIETPTECHHGKHHMDQLINFTEKYWHLMFAMFIMLGFILWLIMRKAAAKENKEVALSIWSYLLIWPILLTRKEGDKYMQRSFTRREWIGWLIFGLVALVAIIATTPKW